MRICSVTHLKALTLLSFQQMCTLRLVPAGIKMLSVHCLFGLQAWLPLWATVPTVHQRLVVHKHATLQPTGRTASAGVPLKAAVAGIAMGLILEQDGRFVILTDILGSEDALGDMDFKVAGSADGVTAFQMDIKVLFPCRPATL